MPALRSLFSPVKAKREGSEEAVALGGKCSCFQPYPERHLVAATANPGSDR